MLTYQAAAAEQWASIESAARAAVAAVSAGSEAQANTRRQVAEELRMLTYADVC
jgi:hypothetical protein